MVLLIGPAVTVIGLVAVFFVMRHRSVQTRSMYSSRRSQIERKVKAARQRTLAPHGRTEKPPTDAEIAAASSMAPAAPAYEAPVPKSAWEVGPTPAPPAYTPPPAAPAFPAPPAAPPEPISPPISEPSWTPGPAEPAWTPSPAAEVAAPPREEPAPVQPAPVATPAGGGWSIVGDAKDVLAEQKPTKDKGKDKKKDKEKQKQADTGGAWSLASGDVPGAQGEEAEVKGPSAALAFAQYALLVVGLVVVLIGVLVMVANSKVT